MKSVFHYTVDFDSLAHHGTKGMHWGERRYQNKDGTWTAEGKLRRRIGDPNLVKKTGKLTKEGKTVLRKARNVNSDVDVATRNRLGITNYQSEGGTLKKGEALYRVANNKKDLTALDRKYFSTNPAENNAWINMFGGQFKRSKEPTYSLMYTPVKDLKVSSNAQLGKEFYEKTLNKNIKNLNMNDLRIASEYYPIKDSVNKKDIFGTSKNNAITKVFDKDGINLIVNKSNIKNAKERNEVLGSVASTLIAYQTEQGRKAVQAMLNAGYDAIPDVNGTDVSYDPIILLNPDDKVKKVSIRKVPNRTLSVNVDDSRWPLMRP